MEVEADGFVGTTEASEGELTFSLEAAAITGTLRGLVRDFRGRALEATIVVDDGESIATDDDGVFEVELEVGEHSVEITAPAVPRADPKGAHRGERGRHPQRRSPTW